MGKENLRREPGEKVMKIKVPDKDMLGLISKQIQNTQEFMACMKK